MIFPAEQFPEIETARLRLRAVTEDDYEMVYVLRSRPRDDALYTQTFVRRL